nr:MAG TPA: hypothetical protein [Caudoviricetes sp.]
MEMKFWGISESRKKSISYRRNTLRDFSERHLKVLPKIDLGDIDDIDTENEYTVDVKIEYDSGDYLYLFNGMVNMETFNIVANYLDMGSNIVIFNLKEILDKLYPRLSDEQLRKALLTFKLSLDINKFSIELSKFNSQNISLFKYCLNKDNPFEVDNNELIKVLYGIVASMDMAKDYLEKYKLSLGDFSSGYVDNVKVDRVLQSNLLCMESTKMAEAYSSNLETIKYSSHYSASNPNTFKADTLRVKVPNLRYEYSDSRDYIGILGNIMEVVKVYDKDMEKIVDPDTPSIIDDYVKDYKDRYQTACQRELQSDINFFRNNRLLEPYTSWRSLGDRRNNAEKEYMVSIEISNISNIIQDLKSLLKSVDILTVKR